LFFSSNLMGSVFFHVLSFLRLLLAYVRDHGEVEATTHVRGAASAGRRRSARTPARGSIVASRIEITRKEPRNGAWVKKECAEVEGPLG
jgi:hypothetical protein